MPTRPSYTLKKGLKMAKLAETMTWRDIGAAEGVSKETARVWANKAEQEQQDRDKKSNGKPENSGKALDFALPIITGLGPKPAEPTKRQKIEAWLKENPKGSYVDYKENGGDAHQTYFHSVRSRVYGKKYTWKKKPPQPSKGAKPTVDIATKVVRLEAENAYYKWALVGERKGWVDRLLKEIDK